MKTAQEIHNEIIDLVTRLEVDGIDISRLAFVISDSEMRVLDKDFNDCPFKPPKGVVIEPVEIKTVWGMRVMVVPDAEMNRKEDSK